MKLRQALPFTILAILVLLLPSCFDNPNYPDEPVLTYHSFTIEGDSADLSVDFTDGNGDIGLSESETQAPYNVGSYYYYNLYVQYWEKHDVLGWIPGKDLNGDSIIFKYRIDRILDGNKEKALKGNISVSIEPIFYNPTSPNSDTIKYRIQLIDRALNKSDWVFTDPIIR
ncbi:MAG: hypothetical protein R2799_04160 [Crocinitomicaceae bacterium]|nr:hypothetical protein [Crocinitomicaceae bacterium]